jgi:hypothetical protein
MTTQILKTILAGVLAGLLLYMVPFIIVKILLFILVIRFIFYLLGGRRYWHHRHYAYASKWEGMSDDEKKRYAEKYGRGCCDWENEKKSNDENKIQ